MTKKQASTIGLVLFITAIVAAIALLPQKDICADEIRGYERQASSSLNAVRKKLSSLKATVAVDDSLRVPNLEGVTATNFPALRACDVHCNLLNRCLRFVFLTPPSEACPNEYSDYKEATKTALNLLLRLREWERAAEHALATNDQLSRVRENITAMENTSGSTGGRIAILRARAKNLETELSEVLSVIDVAAASMN